MLTISGQSAFDYDGDAKLIVNGVETTTITNQFVGGMQGGDMQRGQMGGRR